MKDFFKKVWHWLDGNKTIIGSLLLALLGQDAVKNMVNPNWLEIITYVVVLLTGASAYHHVQKGYLSTRKFIREDECSNNNQIP